MRRISLLVLVLFLLTSCKSTENIVIQHDTIYKNKIEYKTKFVYDSIKDSVSTKQYTKDSIVYIEKFKYKEKLRSVHDTLKIHDTCFITNTDIQERVVYKDRPNSRAPTIILITIIMIISLLCLYKKFKK